MNNTNLTHFKDTNFRTIHSLNTNILIITNTSFHIQVFFSFEIVQVLKTFKIY